MRNLMREVLGFVMAILTVSCGRGPSLPLAIVAARNVAGTVEQLMASGHHPDERDPGGLTPLMWAARTGAVDAMTALLDRGADPDARDTANLWTPLMHAIHRQQPDAVRVLLEYGADPNARTPAFTPLMMASVEQNPTFVMLLLTYGADPAARGFGGATALSNAVSGGALSDIDRPIFGGCRTETVRALKAYDPKLALPHTIAGANAVWWAKFHGCREVLQLVSGM